MHRVRAGLTGLGIVFLFTLAVSVVFAPPEDTGTQIAAPEKAPGEPLAQLGVAPSSDKSGEGGAAAGGAVAGSGGTGSRGTGPAVEPATAPGAAGDDAAAAVPVERPTVAVPEAALSALERGEAARST